MASGKDTPQNPNRVRKNTEPKRDSRTRLAGGSAVGSVLPAPTPEQRRLELQQNIGRAVMSQVMDRVKVTLGEKPNNEDPAKARADIDKLITEYIAVSGVMSNVLETYKLLDLDDDGIQTISSFVSSARRGLEQDQGKDFFTEAQDSTNKIIEDLTQTGRARIVGPDGKLYDMELVAIDADDKVERMPECLSTDMGQHLAADQQFDLTGTYGIGDDNGVLPNMFHGEIISESKLSSIKEALNRESNVEHTCFKDSTHKDTINYKFHRVDGDNPIVAQLPLAYAELARSTAGAYLIEYDMLGSNLLPATAWYANHRTTQWELHRHGQPEDLADDQVIKEPLEQPAPKSIKKPAVRIEEVDSHKQSEPKESPESSVVETSEPKESVQERAKLLAKLAGSLKNLLKDKEKANRREVYNSVVNYLGYAIPRSLIGNINSDDLNNLIEFGSGEDSYGKVQGEHSTLLALSDGMGGAAHGATASQLTIEAFLHDTGLTKVLDEDSLQDIINRAVLMMQKRIVAARERVVHFNRERRSNSGATVVAAEVISDKLVYGSVGDSSIFVVRNGKFILVAGDRGGHGSTLYNNIGDNYTNFNPMPNHLLRDNTLDELSRLERLGNLPAVDKVSKISEYDNVGVFSLQDGDRVVLCSDGIMGDWSEIDALYSQYDINGKDIVEDFGEQTLTDEELVEAVSSGSIDEAVRKLIEIAKKVDDRSIQMFDIKLQN